MLGDQMAAGASRGAAVGALSPVPVIRQGGGLGSGQGVKGGQQHGRLPAMCQFAGSLQAALTSLLQCKQHLPAAAELSCQPQRGSAQTCLETLAPSGVLLGKGEISLTLLELKLGQRLAWMAQMIPGICAGQSL